MWLQSQSPCPGAWARGGEKKQHASIKSVGFPAPKLWHSGLVWSGLLLSRDNCGFDEILGPRIPCKLSMCTPYGYMKCRPSRGRGT